MATNENTYPQSIDSKVDQKTETSNYFTEESQELQEEQELNNLLSMKSCLVENGNMLNNEDQEDANLQRKNALRMEEIKNNLSMFSTWMEPNYQKVTLYKDFCEDFSQEYRMALFENICEFFNDETIVNDNVLFYWKCMVIFLLRNSKKYRYQLGELTLNYELRETNLVMIKNKYIFKCFIVDEQICYFKENGTDYYVS